MKTKLEHARWWKAPLCLTRTRMMWPYTVSGHDYLETQQTPTQILTCKTCGKKSEARNE